MRSQLTLIVTKVTLDFTVAFAVVTAFGWLISIALFLAYWTCGVLNLAVQTEAMRRLGLTITTKEPQC